MALRSLVLALACMACACRSDTPAARPPDAPRQAPAPESPTTTSTESSFTCDDILVRVVVTGDRAVLTLPEGERTLAHTIAASGARYSDGTVTFWNKGEEATLEAGGRTRTCRVRRDPWQEARARGIDFRAVGQEPGWYLEIDHEETMRLVYDYGERAVSASSPSPRSAAGSTTYSATVDGQNLVVSIEERRCEDSMSGEPFPATVSVTLGDRHMQGCGRALDR